MKTGLKTVSEMSPTENNLKTCLHPAKIKLEISMSQIIESIFIRIHKKKMFWRTEFHGESEFLGPKGGQ